MSIETVSKNFFKQLNDNYAHMEQDSRLEIVSIDRLLFQTNIL